MAVPQGQSGGAFLPNAPIQMTSPQSSSFLVGVDTFAVGDLNDIDRIIVNPTPKALTSASAISLFNVTRTSNSYVGGTIEYNVQATDGTDYQSLTGMVTFAMVDKAGTGTFTITEVAGNQAKATSGGSTLTLAWTFVTGTGVGTVKLAATTSLTTTVLQVYYTVKPMPNAIIAIL